MYFDDSSLFWGPQASQFVVDFGFHVFSVCFSLCLGGLNLTYFASWIYACAKVSIFLWFSHTRWQFARVFSCFCIAGWLGWLAGWLGWLFAHIFKWLCSICMSPVMLSYILYWFYLDVFSHGPAVYLHSSQLLCRIFNSICTCFHVALWSICMSASVSPCILLWLCTIFACIFIWLCGVFA